MSTALMIRIDHTASPVVTMTAKQDFVLTAKTVDTKTRTIIADAPVSVVAGTTLYFVESSLPGWYYVGRVEHGRASCSCPSRKPCKHMEAIMSRYEAKMTPVCPASAPFVFRVGEKRVSGATAAEALYKALCLVKVSEVSATCLVNVANLSSGHQGNVTNSQQNVSPAMAA